MQLSDWKPRHAYSAFLAILYILPRTLAPSFPHQEPHYHTRHLTTISLHTRHLTSPHSHTGTGARFQALIPAHHVMIELEVGGNHCRICDKHPANLLQQLGLADS